MKTSDFGRGFVYNLILFASHFEREKFKGLKGELDISLWFNASSDHLFELDIPEQWEKKKIGKLAKELQDLALDIGHGERMMEEIDVSEKGKVIELTKEIGLLIDKELGIKPIKATWD